jgi:glutamate--cysteine ligase catalytic subunit
VILLVIFNGAVEEVDDETQTEHWGKHSEHKLAECPLEPPPPRNSPRMILTSAGEQNFVVWELQLTDFENAAFTAFIVLLTRVILGSI